MKKSKNRAHVRTGKMADIILTPRLKDEHTIEHYNNYAVPNVK